MKEKRIIFYYISMGEKDKRYTLRSVVAYINPDKSHAQDFIVTYNGHEEILGADLDKAVEKANKYIEKEKETHSKWGYHERIANNPELIVGEKIKNHKFKISFETNHFGSSLKHIPVSETHSGKKGCGIDYNASDDVEKERQKIAIALALDSKDKFRKRIAIGNKALKKGLANCIRGARNHFDPREPDDDIYEGSWSVIETIQPKEICRWKNKKIFKNEVEKNIAKTVEVLGRHIPMNANKHIGKTGEKTKVKAMLLEWEIIEGGYGLQLKLKWITEDGKRFITNGALDSSFNKKISYEYLADNPRIKETLLPLDKFVVINATVKEHLTFEKGKKIYKSSRLIRPKI